MFTGFYLSGDHIHEIGGYTGYYLHQGRIFGPRGDTGYFVNDGQICDVQGHTTYFHIGGAFIYGPTNRPPWLSDPPGALGRAT